MRLLKLSVTDDEREAVIEELRERGLGYRVTAGAAEHEDRSMVTVAVPADAVEHVLAALAERGFDRNAFTVSLDTEFAHFEGADEVQDRWGATPNRVAPATLRSKAKSLRQNHRSYVWMMVLSAVVATAGLFLSSPAVVVGSMVIAPVVSPVLTAGVGLVRNDREMFVRSVHMQAYGLVLAVATAALVAWLAKTLAVVPAPLAIEQLELVSLRLSPGALAVAIGLAAGAAGAYGLATEGRTTIVGVMIAAALIPTAAATGLGIAWGNAVVAVGTLLLLVVSLLAVNVGAAATLLLLEYRPDDVDESILEVDDVRTAAVVGVTVVLVVGTLVVAGGLTYRQTSFEHGANAAIDDVLSQEEYRGLDVQRTSIEYRAPVLSDRTVVTVTLVRTSGEEYPGLPDSIRDAIADRSGHQSDDLVIRVQFRDFQTT